MAATMAELAALALLAAFCWGLSTVAAGGGAIVFLPIAAWLVEPHLLPPIIAIASLASSVQRCWLYRREIEWRIVAANVPGLALGVPLGAALLGWLDPRWLLALIGLFLVWTALRHFRRGTPLRLTARPSVFAVSSFVTGAVSAVVGASGPLMNPVYLSAGLVKQAMVGTKAASTLAMQVFKIVAFASLGLLGREALLAGIVVGLGTFLGNWLGAAALGRISTARFSDLVYALVGVAGASMLLRTLG